MKCCQCQGIEQCFDQNIAAGDLKSYRKKGPAKTTRALLAVLKSLGVREASLLDIGGGVGIIQHELIAEGISEAIHVDASTAYLQVSQAEAEQRGHADQITYRHGDFVELAPDIPSSDIVTLDRVICCFDDMPALVGASTAKAKNLYGLVFPRDTWWIKIGVSLANLYLRLRRNPFRIFIHSTDAVDAIVNQNGLTRRFYKQFLFWQVAVYSRLT